MTLVAAVRGARREELLDAADRVVRRDGAGASMAAIATDAGITKPVLYRHFGDRSGLLAALTERWTDRLLVDLRASLQAGGTRRERFERTVGAYLAAIDAEPQVYRFLLHHDERGPAPQVRGFTRRLASMLADGMALEQGGPRGVREQIWASGVVGMVQTAGDEWLETRPCPREQVARELTDLVWGAYAVEE